MNFISVRLKLDNLKLIYWYPKMHEDFYLVKWVLHSAILLSYNYEEFKQYLKPKIIKGTHNNCSNM